LIERSIDQTLVKESRVLVGRNPWQLQFVEVGGGSMKRKRVEIRQQIIEVLSALLGEAST
jgi:hypothetical protein